MTKVCLFGCLPRAETELIIILFRAIIEHIAIMRRVHKRIGRAVRCSLANSQLTAGLGVALSLGSRERLEMSIE